MNVAGRVSEHLKLFFAERTGSRHRGLLEEYRVCRLNSCEEDQDQRRQIHGQLDHDASPTLTPTLCSRSMPRPWAFLTLHIQPTAALRELQGALHPIRPRSRPGVLG